MKNINFKFVDDGKSLTVILNPIEQIKVNYRFYGTKSYFYQYLHENLGSIIINPKCIEWQMFRQFIDSSHFEQASKCLIKIFLRDKDQNKLFSPKPVNPNKLIESALQFIN